MPPSEGLKMLVSTKMTEHDDGNLADGPFEMATWDVSRAHFYGEARRWIYTYLPEGHEQVAKHVFTVSKAGVQVWVLQS